MWVTVDAQSNQKEDVKRETVYCLDDDNETEVPMDDTVQGESPGVDLQGASCSPLMSKSRLTCRLQVIVTAATSFLSPKWIRSR